MLASDNHLSDVSLYWPAHSRRIAEIARTGRCPSYAVPRRAKRRAVVALVDVDGEVLLSFRLSRIDEGQSVIGANGKRYPNGCILVAELGTVQRPPAGSVHKLSVNRHAIGAIGYFDAKSKEGVFYSLTGTMPRAQSESPSYGTEPRHRIPLFADNVGKYLSQPERALIADYVRWTESEDKFEHHFLRGPGLPTDLFYRPRWVLFEAKATVDRKVLREAIGQLMDYQRYYERHPRLAVLTSERPHVAMLDLLAAKRIVAVWRSRGGSFADSVAGGLTIEVRDEWH